MARPIIPNDGSGNAVPASQPGPETVPEVGPDRPNLPSEPSVKVVAVAKRSLSVTIALVVGFFSVVASVVVLGLIAEGVRTQQANAPDDLATPFLHRLASPSLDALMQAASFTGSNTVIIPLAVTIAVLLVWLKRRRDALFLTIVVAGCLALNGTMKLVFQRPRPQVPWAQPLPDYSFPSGHSMTSLVFFLTLAFFMWAARGRTVGIALVALALLLSLIVGVSRIYLGYHYLTDVVAGFLAGLLWLLVVFGAFIGGQRLLGSSHGRDVGGPDAA